MKVKVGDNIYYPNNQAIMIILNEGEKKQIYEMPIGVNKYCQYPTGMSVEKITEFMKISLCGVEE